MYFYLFLEKLLLKIEPSKQPSFLQQYFPVREGGWTTLTPCVRHCDHQVGFAISPFDGLVIPSGENCSKKIKSSEPSGMLLAQLLKVPLTKTSLPPPSQWNTIGNFRPTAVSIIGSTVSWIQDRNNGNSTRTERNSISSNLYSNSPFEMDKQKSWKGQMYAHWKYHPSSTIIFQARGIRQNFRWVKWPGKIPD